MNVSTAGSIKLSGFPETPEATTQPGTDLSTLASHTGGFGSGQKVTSKKELKKYLINACDSFDSCNKNSNAQSTSCFSRTPKSVRLINQSVNKYKEPDTVEGIVPDFVGSESGQRLHRKAAASNLKPLEEVIRAHGVDINAQSKKSGDTPMISAAKNNHWDMVAILLKNAPEGSVVAENESQMNLLRYFLSSATVRALSAADYENMLRDIMKNGHEQAPLDVSRSFSARALEMIADTCTERLFLVAQKAIPDDSSHPLKSRKFSERLLQRIASGKFDNPVLIRHLLKLRSPGGAKLIDPCAATPEGNTPLILASYNGNHDAVAALLEDERVKKSINKVNPKKSDPYTAYTAAHYWGNGAIMKLLAQAGAYPYNASVTRAAEIEARERANRVSSRGNGLGGFGGDLFGSFVGQTFSGFGGGGDC